MLYEVYRTLATPPSLCAPLLRVPPQTRRHFLGPFSSTPKPCSFVLFSTTFAHFYQYHERRSTEQYAVYGVRLSSRNIPTVLGDKMFCYALGQPFYFSGMSPSVSSLLLFPVNAPGFFIVSDKTPTEYGEITESNKFATVISMVPNCYNREFMLCTYTCIYIYVVANMPQRIMHYGLYAQNMFSFNSKKKKKR